MNMQGVIAINDVLDEIDSGRRFKLVHVTADESRGTGGEIKVRDGWIKCQLEALPQVILHRNKIYRDSKPNQWTNKKVRLILNPATQDIRAVHIRLISEFNGKRVV